MLGRTLCHIYCVSLRAASQGNAVVPRGGLTALGTWGKSLAKPLKTTLFNRELQLSSGSCWAIFLASLWSQHQANRQGFPVAAQGCGRRRGGILLSSRFQAGVGHTHCPIELISILGVASRKLCLSDHVAWFDFRPMRIFTCPFSPSQAAFPCPSKEIRKTLRRPCPPGDTT